MVTIVNNIVLFFLKKICLFCGCAGFSVLLGPSPLAENGGSCLVSVGRFLVAVAPLVMEQRL